MKSTSSGAPKDLAATLFIICSEVAGSGEMAESAKARNDASHFMIDKEEQNEDPKSC